MNVVFFDRVFRFNVEQDETFMNENFLNVKSKDEIMVLLFHRV